MKLENLIVVYEFRFQSSTKEIKSKNISPIDIPIPKTTAIEATTAVTRTMLIFFKGLLPTLEATRPTSFTNEGKSSPVVETS